MLAVWPKRLTNLEKRLVLWIRTFKNMFQVLWAGPKRLNGFEKGGTLFQNYVFCECLAGCASVAFRMFFFVFMCVVTRSGPQRAVGARTPGVLSQTCGRAQAAHTNVQTQVVHTGFGPFNFWSQGGPGRTTLGGLSVGPPNSWALMLEPPTGFEGWATQFLGRDG